MALDPDTLNQLLDTISRFVEERLRPLEHQVAEQDAIPADTIDEMRELGLFGLSIPEEYGGLGLTMAEEVQVVFRLARTSPAFRSLIGTNNGIGSQGIVIDGTDEREEGLSAATRGPHAHQFLVSDRTGRRLRCRIAQDHGAPRQE